MNIEITPHTLVGTVDAIASKSHAHRLLISAALSKKPAKVNISTTSQDIDATRQCLRQLKADVPLLNCG